ncbi:MAG: helix-turn-helix domain-containing protein [Firmicutes bacterium]|nr:helix-turn-helix domain-containing protein [Bacillota bacterium]
MDQQKIGRFIAACRRGKNYTQEQLAEKLGVSNRTVSRWENGNNMPDLSLFEPLCAELGISINELLSGQRIEPQNIEKEAADNIIAYGSYVKRRSRNRTLLLLITAMLALCLLTVSLVAVGNKTFTKTVYHSEFLDNVSIAVPRYSFHRKTGGLETYTASFKTLKQPDAVNVFIDSYLAGFEEIPVGEDTYYYHRQKDFTIYNYRINNDGISFVNTIYIGYHDGYFSEPI